MIDQSKMSRIKHREANDCGNVREWQRGKVYSIKVSRNRTYNSKKNKNIKT